MQNLLIVSENELLKQDLIFQIEQYAPEFNIVSEDSATDIIIIDQALELINSYANKFPHSPIFVLLEKGVEQPKEKGLIKYFQKPISLSNFINSLCSAINLASNSKAGKITFNKYELRPSRKEILNLRNSEIIKLTEKEVSIIQYLYKNKDRIISKAELLQEVWEYNPDVSTHTIETHIYRLRQKVEHNNENLQLIITQEGGYMLKK